MQLSKSFNVLLLILFFTFSWWLMAKSFGYDVHLHQFRVARHEVGDFGLHISLIRSFSWGKNYPSPQSPFFPGIGLLYHYGVDMLTGFLEKVGVRIDLAYNGVSAIAFTALLYLIYLFPQRLFGKSILLGMLSVLLFIFPSTLSFIDFFRTRPLSFSLIHDVWYLPDYIHRGPFDGSLVSIYFTLAPYLNQRHLIVGLALALGILYRLVPRLLQHERLSVKELLLTGLVLGLSSRVHGLLFFGTTVMLVFLFIWLKRFRELSIFLVSVLVFSVFHIIQIIGERPELVHRAVFNPGFLSPRPLSLSGFSSYWGWNLGIAVLLLPVAVFVVKSSQRLFFLSFLTLFILANVFQFSFRIEHNHSLINYFIVLSNFYIARLLVLLWTHNSYWKLATAVAALPLIASGILNLMAVKNDFQWYVPDAPSQPFMQWIKTQTKPDSIFLAHQELYDPVTMAGRKNYLGHSYYTSVMGYNTSVREKNIALFSQGNDAGILGTMRQERIDYVAISTDPGQNFFSRGGTTVLNNSLPVVYRDAHVVVYKL